MTDPLADLAGTPLETLLASIDNALRNGSDMNNANLAFLLLCDRLGVDRDALVHDRGWSTRHLPPDPGGPVGFTCPICGAHDPEPTVSMESVIVESRPQVEAWPGGPLVEDYGKPPERKVVDRDVTTTACEHTFKTSEWAFAGHRHETSGREWVTVERKAEVSS